MLLQREDESVCAEFLTFDHRTSSSFVGFCDDHMRWLITTRCLKNIDKKIKSFQDEHPLYTPGLDENRAVANLYAASGYVIGTLHCSVQNLYPAVEVQYIDFVSCTVVVASNPM